MKKIFTLIMLTGSFYASSLFAQGWQWRNSETQSNILKDQNNNLYIFTNYSTGISIKKRNLSGNVLWTKSITGGAKVTSYQIDPANNLVLLGNITSTATVDNHTLVPKSASNFFILKISSSSSLLSTKVYGDTCEASANDMFINSTGEYLIGGGYKGNFNMNGTPITGDTLTNFFIIKTDPNQNVLWYETNGYVPGAEGSTSVTELLETSSGNICAVYQTTGLVNYKGQQDSYDGQFIMELDASRNLLWRKYQCYCWMGYNPYLDLRSIGDTVYMKSIVYYNHSSPDTWINRWTPAGTVTSKYMGNDQYFGYNTFNNKIYFAAIYPYPTSSYTVSFYRHIGSLYSNLSTCVSDSAYFPMSGWNLDYYTDLECIDSSRYYIGGKDSTPGVFVGLFDMNNMPLSITEKTQTESAVFPNPFTGIVNVTGIPPNASVKVYNSNGCEVKCFLKDSEINLSIQPAGIYLMELFDGNRRVTKKIVLE